MGVSYATVCVSQYCIDACVCVCVCARTRKKRASLNYISTKQHQHNSYSCLMPIENVASAPDGTHAHANIATTATTAAEFR